MRLEPRSILIFLGTEDVLINVVLDSSIRPVYELKPILCAPEFRAR